MVKYANAVSIATPTHERHSLHETCPKQTKPAVVSRKTLVDTMNSSCQSRAAREVRVASSHLLILSNLPKKCTASIDAQDVTWILSGIKIRILPHWMSTIDSSGNHTIGTSTLNLICGRSILSFAVSPRLLAMRRQKPNVNINARNARMMPPA